MKSKYLYEKNAKYNRKCARNIESTMTERKIKIEQESKKNDIRRDYINKKYFTIIKAVLNQLERQNENFDVNSQDGINSIERILSSSSLCGKVYEKKDIPELINAVRRNKNLEDNREEK